MRARAADRGSYPVRRARALLAASAVTLAAGWAGLLGAAPAAEAAVSISQFTITPSSDQAGGSPDISLDVGFISPDGDSPRDATISLGTGILASPSAATICSASDFAANNCPQSSQIGRGTITGTAYGQQIPIPAGVYLVTPQGSEVARIGVIVDFFDYPVAALTAPVEIRTAPDVGIDIPIDGIPDEIESTPVQVNAIDLTLFGTVNGQPFTRLPTSCGASTTTITVDSYSAPATPESAAGSLTPTGCASLGYSPQVAASATPDSGDDGVAFSATIRQATTDAATRSIAMTLPPGVGPRLSALGGACASPTAPGCVAVGSATVTTPLLAAPLQGQVVLVSHPGGLPSIDAVFPAPLAFTLPGAPTLGSAGLTATFSGLPDVPISTLQVSFAGGPGSVLVANPGLCSSPQQLAADLTAQDGATAHLAPAVTVTGICPPRTSQSSSTVRGGSAGSGSGGAGSGRAGGAGGIAGAGAAGGAGGTAHLGSSETRPSVRISLSGRVLTLSVTAGRGERGLSAVSVRLPGGITIDRHRWPHGLTVRLDRKALPAKQVSDRGGLRLILNRRGRALSVRLGSPLLKIARRLLVRSPHGHGAQRITFVISVRDAAGTTSVLPVTVAA